MKRDLRKENEYSITNGKILPAFVMFMIPLMASSCLMQSYGIIDGLILGNMIGEEAIGAVNSISPILDVCILVQIALAGGCSICVSHLYGAERYSDLSRLIKDMYKITLVITIVILAVVFSGAEALLRLINTPKDLFASALTYLRIVFIGVPFTAIYNLQSGVIRGMGDSKKPLGAIAISSVVNISLDLLFIAVFRLGIGGAAIATVLAQAMSVAYLQKKIREKLRSIRYDADVEPEPQVRECVRLGLPQIVQSLATSAGNILLQNVTNLLGATVVIGVTAAFKVDAILVIPLFCLGQATSVFTGQNAGAARYDRVRQTLKISLIFALAVASVMAVVLWSVGYPLMGLFGLEEASAAAGYRYIMVCMPFYWLFGLQFVLNGYLNGSKHTLVASAASIVGLAGRLTLAYLLYQSVGADVLPAGEAVSWLTVVLFDVIYLICQRKKQYDPQ